MEFCQLNQSQVSWYLVNDIHMAELDSVQKFIETQGWLLQTFFIVYTINEVLLILLSRCLKNVIHHINGKNEWLLLSVTFTPKLELFFVLTFKNTFS